MLWQFSFISGVVKLAKSVAVLALSGIFSAVAVAAEVELKPGKYALTITYEVQDQRQSESQTGTRCIAPRDLQNPEKVFNDRTTAMAKEDEACSVKDLRSAGGKISYNADCSNRLVHVEGRLAGTEFSVVRTVKPKASQGVSLKVTVRGSRTGDCSRARNADKR
jgi:Protein of unknown function (DUF3617)